MQRTKMLAAVAAATTLLAFVTAAPAAAALEFKESAMGLLSAAALNTQVWKTAGGEVKCTKLEAEKSATSEAELNPEWQLLEVVYSSCTAFGFISTNNFKVMYDFNINGFFRIENEVVIEASGCTVRIFGAPANQALREVKYVENEGALEVVFAVANIESQGEEFCTYAKEGKGTFKGSMLLKLPAGVINA